MSDQPARFEPEGPPFDDALIGDFLEFAESFTFDCKRLGDKLTKILDTIVAFANSDGGTIAVGLEDPDKGRGRDRIYGIQENPMQWDEVRRLIPARITEPNLLPWRSIEVGCTLRDGSRGSVGLLRIEKSTRIHSIVGNGTFRRLDRSNQPRTAPEINELSFARGTITAEGQCEAVDFDLLDTVHWRAFARKRRLTRPIDSAMRHLGLARIDSSGELRPIRAGGSPLRRGTVGPLGR